jgi:hypothetical protein
MYRIIPTVAGDLALQTIAGSSGLSREANAVQEAAAKVLDLAERSDIIFGDKAAALSDLAKLGTECANPGWDGDDAAPIDPDAIILARRFILAMPYGIPVPEFAPEPDGKISLDWGDSRNRVFSLTVGHGNRLAYAFLDGGDTGHATVQFDGRVIPLRVLNEIKAATSNARASVRAA